MDDDLDDLDFEDDKIETNYIVDDNIFKKKNKFIEKNPWVAPNYTSTDIPHEYQKHMELHQLPFLSVYEILRIISPFGPITPDHHIWENIKTRCRSFRLNEYIREVCRLHFENQNV